METLDQALDAVRNEGTPPPTDPTPPVGNDAPQPSTPDTTDYPQSTRDYLAQNPDHAPIAKIINDQLKAAWTPRLQEAADLRRQFEGLDANVAAAVRHLQQLIQTDPRNAAEYLRQQAVLLEGANATPAQPSTPEFATDVEEMLYNQYQQLAQRVQTYEQQFQQQQQQTRALSVNQEFEKLEQEFGIQVPWDQRASAWELSEMTQGKMTVTDAFFALNRNAVLPNLLQKARDEASSIVQQKAGLVGPGGLSTREGPAPVTGPQDFDTIWREMRGS